jgi:hypothetical protein
MEMLFTALLFAAAASAVELTVTTHTGRFIGGLNDTYPDVRHFKWIPYAKVLCPPLEYLRSGRSVLINLATRR